MTMLKLKFAVVAAVSLLGLSFEVGPAKAGGCWDGGCGGVVFGSASARLINPARAEPRATGFGYAGGNALGYAGGYGGYGGGYALGYSGGYGAGYYGAYRGGLVSAGGLRRISWRSLPASRLWWISWWPLSAGLLGRVDGFDQDECARERDERTVIPRCLLATNAMRLNRLSLPTACSIRARPL